MGFGANTADLMNLCGLSMEQGISVISTPEARKEAAEPISLSMSFPPDTPKTPLTSGRQFLHHGATPSPSLLNPISDEDWKESTSRLSILCPKLPSPKTSEILLRRLKAGYRLVRFLAHRYEVLVDIHYFSKFMFLAHSHHCKRHFTWKTILTTLYYPSPKNVNPYESSENRLETSIGIMEMRSPAITLSLSR